MNYEEALQVATAAARRAGAILLEEFHRPGGPRGGGGKCEADVAAEREIRQALSARFPEHGIVGEELAGEDRRSRDGRHVWLIDPNDGTAAYLKGWRGSAVSIALLRDGVPVLGAVTAYAARAGRGDLFCWAEGGPLTRNGRARQPLSAARLDPRRTVLVSQHADEKPAVNARLCAPARFRAEPGIAYRLALAAAGEGVAGVSVNRPCAYDFAGGHALLRGAGGELFYLGDPPEPVTYSEGGAAGDCVGGPPEIARELAARPWREVFSSTKRPRDEPFDAPLRPEPSMICADAGLLDRAQGCMLGQIAGDNLGALVEFRDAAEIAESDYTFRELVDGGRWGLIAGQPTDDSELALMLARSIVASAGFDPEAVAKAYVHWYESGPFDVGCTISAALGAGAGAQTRGEDVAAALRRAAQANSGSQANGALMRIAPLAIFAHALPEETIARMAREDTALTHASRVCQDAGAVFAVTVARAVAHGGEPAELYAFARQWSAANACGEVAGAIAAAARSAPPPEAPIGWVLVALQNAFYRLVHERCVEDVIERTVRAGGDTDTTAAIAGALAGACHGACCMPAQWLDRILTCRPMEGIPGVRRPRPPEFWPVDSLLLAERLVVLGRAARGR